MAKAGDCISHGLPGDPGASGAWAALWVAWGEA